MWEITKVSVSQLTTKYCAYSFLFPSGRNCFPIYCIGYFARRFSIEHLKNVKSKQNVLTFCSLRWKIKISCYNTINQTKCGVVSFHPRKFHLHFIFPPNENIKHFLQKHFQLPDMRRDLRVPFKMFNIFWAVWVGCWPRVLMFFSLPITHAFPVHIIYLKYWWSSVGLC